MDAVGTRLEGSAPKLEVVVLADGEHRPVAGAGPGDRGHAVIGSSREVHDHAVDVRQ